MLWVFKNAQTIYSCKTLITWFKIKIKKKPLNFIRSQLTLIFELTELYAIYPAYTIFYVMFLKDREDACGCRTISRGLQMESLYGVKK